MKNKRNYYRILQVQPDAPPEIIRASYLAIMKELKIHPDLGGENSDASLINEAYETLRDRAKRSEYDKKLKMNLVENYNKCIHTIKTKNNKINVKSNNNRAYNRIKKSEPLYYSFSRLQTDREAKLIDLSPQGLRLRKGPCRCLPRGRILELLPLGLVFSPLASFPSLSFFNVFFVPAVNPVKVHFLEVVDFLL